MSELKVMRRATDLNYLALEHFRINDSLTKIASFSDGLDEYVFPNNERTHTAINSVLHHGVRGSHRPYSILDALLIDEGDRNSLYKGIAYKLGNRNGIKLESILGNSSPYSGTQMMDNYDLVNLFGQNNILHVLTILEQELGSRDEAARRIKFYSYGKRKKDDAQNELLFPSELHLIPDYEKGIGYIFILPPRESISK